MPGMEVPGIATEYLVVDDEESESMFRELQHALAGPDSRPTTISMSMRINPAAHSIPPARTCPAGRA